MARAQTAPTERERKVLDGIDRRIPIKVIAAELGVSETRINQHIRNLKDRYNARSLAELVDHHRAATLPEPVYRNAQLPENPTDDASTNRAANGPLFFAKPEQTAHDAVWLAEAPEAEPRVVPGVLDKPHPVRARLLAILAMTLAIMAMLVLSLAAARTLGEAIDGWGSVPATQQPPAG